jgi:hypothetical protein
MADPVHLPGRLRLGRESPGKDAEGQACMKARRFNT